MAQPPRLFPARGLSLPPARAGQAAATEAKAVQLPPALFWTDGNPYRSDLAPQRDVGAAAAYAASALVYACMSFRARKLSEAPLWIADEKDGNETWLAGSATHPLADLLEQPNPDQPAAAFLAALSLAMDAGPALVVKNRDRTGRVASLYVFGCYEFTVKPAGGRLYGEFTVTSGDGTQTPLGPDDVMFFPPLGGVSPVDAALAHVRINDTMRRAVKSSLARSMRPGSVTSVEGSLQDDTFERFKQQLGALYGGADNAGRNLVLDAGAKFTPLSASLKDLELGPVQGDVEAAICQVFAIHPILVGAKIALENMSGFADSLKPALSYFYDLAAFPRWQEIETALTAGLLREVDPTPARFVRFVKDKVRALKPDLTANVAIAKTATGIMTLDEQRAALMLKPVGAAAGGDTIAKPVDPQAGNLTAEERAAGGSLKTAAPARETKAAPPNTPAQAAAFWRAFDTKAAARVPAYAAAARGLFRQERAGVLATLRAAERKGAAASLERKDDGGGTAERTTAELLAAALIEPYLEAAIGQIAADYADGGPYAQAWAEEFGTLLRATMTDAAGTFISGIDAGLGVQFSMDNPALLAAIRDRAAALVQHVTDTTRAAITDAIASGRAEGLTLDEIAQRVDAQAFGAEAAARALTIASTEVVGAIDDAEWTAAVNAVGGDGAPLMRAKRWIHTRRPGQRDYHEAHEHEGPNDGWVPMAYAYTAQDGTPFLRPFAPGLPASEVVRCGCTMAYSDVDPAQAQEEG